MRPKDEPPVNPSEEVPQAPLEVQHRKPSPSKRKYKGNNSNIAAAATASSSQRQDPQKAASHTTLIRRVQAVVRIKREESDDDFIEEVSGAAKDEAASDEDQIPSSNQRRSSRRSRKIIKDDEENVDQNYLAADGNPVWDLRHRNGTINYREEDEDDDDVDELMMGAEVNKPGSVYISFFFLTHLYNFRVLRCLVLNFQSHSHYYHHPRKNVNWLHDDNRDPLRCILFKHLFFGYYFMYYHVATSSLPVSYYAYIISFLVFFLAHVVSSIYATRFIVMLDKTSLWQCIL